MRVTVRISKGLENNPWITTESKINTPTRDEAFWQSLYTMQAWLVNADQARLLEGDALHPSWGWNKTKQTRQSVCTEYTLPSPGIWISGHRTVTHAVFSWQIWNETDGNRAQVLHFQHEPRWRRHPHSAGWRPETVSHTSSYKQIQNAEPEFAKTLFCLNSRFYLTTLFLSLI